VASIYFAGCSWLLRRSRRVLPVEDSFSNQKMRTFSRIRAHQSSSETFNTSLRKRKTKPASVNYFAIEVMGHGNEYNIVVHLRETFLSFLYCGTSCSRNYFSSQCQKEPVSSFNQYCRIFSGTLAGQKVQRPISFPPVIASAISSIVFFDDTS